MDYDTKFTIGAVVFVVALLMLMMAVVIDAAKMAGAAETCPRASTTGGE